MSTALDILLKLLIQQYFAPPKCVLFISDNSEFKLSMPLGTLNVNLNGNTSKLSEALSRDFRCDNFILNVKEPNFVFSFIETELPKFITTLSERKYLIFSKFNSPFQSPLAKFVSNILLAHVDEEILSQKNRLSLLNEADIKVRFWTNRFTGNSSNNVYDNIDNWYSANRSFSFNRNLFYDKLRNLHGRNFKVGTIFEYRPFVMIDDEIRKTYISGMEIQLLKCISDYMNATMEIVVVEDLWGKVFDNGSSYGVIGEVYKDKIDVAAAGLLLTQIRDKLFTLSHAVARVDITCLVPAPGFKKWRIPFKSFSLDTWILLAVTCFTLGTFIFVINHFSRLSFNQHTSRKKISRLDSFTLAAAICAKPILRQQISTHYNFKVYLYLVFMTALIVGASYDAGLSSVMTKPSYGNFINTMEDFLNSDIQWMELQVPEWIQIWRDSPEERYKRAGNRFTTTSRAELREKSKVGNIAFITKRVWDTNYVLSFMKEDVLNKYRKMKEKLHSQYICLMLRKHSVFLPEINKIIGRLWPSGLFRVWAAETVGHEYYKFQQKLQHLNDDDLLGGPKKLYLTYFYGPIFLLILGNSIAFVIFITEYFLCFQL